MELRLSSAISPEDLPSVYGHEVGHVIDQIAGEIPTDGLSQELKPLYDFQNPSAQRNSYGPSGWATQGG